ncbi:NAD(P)/FAD-dependent oxidoreductase [Stagnimonas aquatica]|uniref:NAD(P)/FAD-dependent oxidoreductase n=1 Tax=Stagnimonas aquatica TaxID=2689987 RepID=A0A3N0VKC2_9GAMM|nr:NAD(P)/FAD-dependent oxidoreductase [Stagnimonas aquatica]ROH93216.1 NAD(P)/FAD-dependent oxidoreductase [Stagnimonas aquatica]
MSLEHFDVLIVGAGLSGIGAAVHLGQQCPQQSYAILEGRETLGGTWDLFRYPGIRSDSDMYTLGYSFRPWTAAKAIADGPAILDYMREVVRDYGLGPHIRYQHRVVGAEWSTPEARWTVEVERGPQRERLRLSCRFLYLCAGYYDYAGGYTPDYPGLDRFRGRFVHPQQWPADLDYRGQRVVVIGSGATAVTLVPSMAREAAQVTMLQRSPTYILALPGQDAIANGLRRLLPAKLAYAITRWKNVLMQMFFFNLCRRAPGLARKLIRAGVRHQLPRGFDVDKHFAPSYDPWDQRVCLVPDGDLFRALRSGKADIVTDHIDSFTERGIRLKSGQELAADVVVSATGLKLLALGGLEFVVDGERVDLSSKLSYKGMMISDIPNMALAIGYTNASWTLKVDLSSAYLCRLLKHMDQHGYRQCTPRRRDPELQEQPLIDFSSGYVQRAIEAFPKQGSKSPWKLYQNYLFDLLSLRYGAVDDGSMEFSGALAK